MSMTDLAWMAVIAAGAVYVLYRSLWKKRGYCHGCPTPKNQEKKM